MHSTAQAKDNKRQGSIKSDHQSGVEALNATIPKSEPKSDKHEKENRGQTKIRHPLNQYAAVQSLLVPLRTTLRVARCRYLSEIVDTTHNVRQIVQQTMINTRNTREAPLSGVRARS